MQCCSETQRFFFYKTHSVCTPNMYHPSFLSFFSPNYYFLSTFNPADYTANSGGRQEAWEGDVNETAEGPGEKSKGPVSTFLVECLILQQSVLKSAVMNMNFFSLGTWGGNLEDWTSEDWNEDVRTFLFYYYYMKGICHASVSFLCSFGLYRDVLMISLGYYGNRHKRKLLSQGPRPLSQQEVAWV